MANIFWRDIVVRKVIFQDKNQVNCIRKQVHELHLQARPDMFNPSSDELMERFDLLLADKDYQGFVCEIDNKVVGWMLTKHILQPQSAYAPQREYLLIEEFGVEQQSRRRCVGSQLIEAAKQYANSLGLKRIQLDVWAFNGVAEEFYKAVGFDTYRKFLEIIL